jgi:hypothetical protein
MMSAIRRNGRLVWIIAGVALALAAVFFLTRDPVPDPAASGKPVSPDELVKLLRENTVRAEPSPRRSTPPPRLDQRESP